MDKSDISTALLILGRRMPTSKYIPLALEIALLATYFSSKPSKGLDPTFYHTLSYEGDMEQYEKLEKMVKSVIT